MILLTILLVLIGIVLLIWLSGFLFGAAFQVSEDESVKNIVKLSGIKKGEKVVDLGSGTGKIVIEFAKKGAIATGFEINPFLVWFSRRRIKKLGLEKRAKIIKENFWNANLSRFNVIIIFQIFYLMPSLEKKLRKELKNSRVISNTWKFPGKKPEKKEGKILLYKF